MSDIVISAFCISYNHGKYIARAIEGVVSQQCSYKFEFIISDDCSKDDTASIIREYAAKYPDIIKPILNNKNVGMQRNYLQALYACQGKYVAFLEGDDFWIDPLKLQKQADFLEQNPDFSFCFSDVDVIDELNVSHTFYPPFEKDVYTLSDMVLNRMNIIPTPTIFLRNILPRRMPDFYFEGLSGDIIVALMLADKGKAKFMSEKMAVFRNHAGGITKNPEYIARQEQSLKNTFAAMNRYFDFRYNDIFRQRLLDMAKEELIFGAREKKGKAKWQHYVQKFPQYIKYSKGVNLKEVLYFHAILFFPSILKKVAAK